MPTSRVADTYKAIKAQIGDQVPDEAVFAAAQIADMEKMGPLKLELKVDGPDPYFYFKDQAHEGRAVKITRLDPREAGQKAGYNVREVQEPSAAETAKNFLSFSKGILEVTQPTDVGAELSVTDNSSSTMGSYVGGKYQPSGWVGLAHLLNPKENPGDTGPTPRARELEKRMSTLSDKNAI